MSSYDHKKQARRAELSIKIIKGINNLIVRDPELDIIDIRIFLKENPNYTKAGSLIIKSIIK